MFRLILLGFFFLFLFVFIVMITGMVRIFFNLSQRKSRKSPQTTRRGPYPFAQYNENSQSGQEKDISDRAHIIKDDHE